MTEEAKATSIVSIAGSEGTIHQIDLRYTVLVGDQARILIPNSTLFTNNITVSTNGAGALGA